jgi:hypothetical protein
MKQSDAPWLTVTPKNSCVQAGNRAANRIRSVEDR